MHINIFTHYPLHTKQSVQIRKKRSACVLKEIRRLDHANDSLQTPINKKNQSSKFLFFFDTELYYMLPPSVSSK